MRYRKNVKDLPGKPDIVLPKYKTVVFVNGCFWHKHDCPRFVWPSSNREYWVPKIQRNVERDIENTRLLEEQEWQVLAVWECQLKAETAKRTLFDLAEKIRNNIEYDYGMVKNGQKKLVTRRNNTCACSILQDSFRAY